jgi:hypothetical protein
MAPFFSVDWAFSIAGWALGSIGIFVLAWAIFWDRSRGRRRCPKCWYDMMGCAGLVCPECGYSPPSEAQLFRTRRRWWYAALSLLVAIASYPLAHAGRIARAGWSGALPTTVLIYWVGLTEPAEQYVGNAMTPPSSAAAELARRAGTDPLWDWQWRLLLHQLRIVQSRERWPVGTAWRVSIRAPSWLGTIGRLNAEALPEAFESAHDSNRERLAIPPIGLPSEVLPLRRTSRTVTLRLATAKWQGDISLPVEQVERADHAILPATTSALDAAVRQSLQTGLRRDVNQATETEYVLGARLFRSKGLLPDDVAVGVVIELRRDGVTAASWSLIMIDSPFGEPVDWIRISAPAPGWDLSNPSDLKRWTVHVRGSPDVAIGDFSRTRAWSGQYTVPLSEFLTK